MNKPTIRMERIGQVIELHFEDGSMLRSNSVEAHLLALLFQSRFGGLRYVEYPSEDTAPTSAQRREEP